MKGSRKPYILNYKNQNHYNHTHHRNIKPKKTFKKPSHARSAQTQFYNAEHNDAHEVNVTPQSDDDDQRKSNSILDSGSHPTHKLLTGATMKKLATHSTSLTGIDTPIPITQFGSIIIPTNNGLITTRVITSHDLPHTVISKRDNKKHGNDVIFTHNYSFIIKTINIPKKIINSQ